MICLLSALAPPGDVARLPRAQLEKQRGVRQLIRRTSAIAVLGSVPAAAGGGEVAAIITVWGSALTQDFDGDLGGPLELSVNSFRWEQPERP